MAGVSIEISHVVRAGRRACKESPAELLVLYHQIYLRDTSTRDDLLQEMSAYKGDFVSGLDLDIY